MLTATATITDEATGQIAWTDGQIETVKPLGGSIQRGVIDAIRIRSQLTGAPQTVKVQDDTQGETIKVQVQSGTSDPQVFPWTDADLEPKPNPKPTQAIAEDDVPPLPAKTPSRKQNRPSFAQQIQNLPPAAQGWRGGLNRLGLRLAPDTQEIQDRDWKQAVSQHWPGLRTIAVINRKGGSAKTPTTILLSAVFARNGGGGVVAWDNSGHGNLGERTIQGPHSATVADLLPDIDGMMAPQAKAGDLARYTHHQPDDRFDVLRCEADPASDHLMKADEVKRTHELLAKYYRLIIIDTGNEIKGEDWGAAIDCADQLVIPISGPEESAAGAAETIERLIQKGGRWAQLAQEAIVILSDRYPSGEPKIDWLANEFAHLVAQVVHIPYDPAMKSGVIRFEALRPQTQRAWMQAGATVAAALSK